MYACAACCGVWLLLALVVEVSGWPPPWDVLGGGELGVEVVVAGLVVVVVVVVVDLGEAAEDFAGAFDWVLGCVGVLTPVRAGP
jgi:hypothetical protein